MAFFRKRGDKWYFTLRYKDEFGKWRSTERVGGYTKNQCKAAYHKAMVSLEAAGNIEELSLIRMEELLKEWLDISIFPTKKENTYKLYESIVRIHLIPALGEMQVRKITPKQLQKFINEKKMEGLSLSTLKILLAVLKNAFTYAVAFNGCITVNPASNVKLPRYDNPPEELKVFSPEEMEKILSHFGNSKLSMAILCSYHLGLRQGECCALRWKDIDFKNGIVSIHSTILKDGSIQGTPKTYTSYRKIPFGKKFREILEAEKLRQNKLRFEYGPWWQGEDFVCAEDNGKHLILNSFRYFNMWVKKNIGHGTFHTLRHTHATYLLESGMELELVSKRLGHSSLTITAKTYSHILEKRTEKTIEYLDAAL